MPRFVNLLRPEIRPLSILNDIGAVADLIDVCFSSQMDSDGLEYLRYIRKVASGARMFRWVDGAHERISVPSWQKKWVYLIANVAVDPAYRRRGIARWLTKQAVEHAHYREVDQLWLQVKDYNQPAIQLYESLGFVTHAKRNSWCSSNLIYPPEPDLSNGYHVVPRSRKDWNIQREWLQGNYPDDIRWYFGIQDEDFAPGFLKSLEKYLLYEQVSHHFSVYDRQTLVGGIVYQPVNQKTHHLFLGVPKSSHEYEALRSLLVFALRLYGQERKLRVNYPFGRGHAAFEDSHYFLQNTLNWMKFEGYNRN